MISDLTAGLILLAVYVRCAAIVIRRRSATPAVGRIIFELGGEGSSSPTGIRISARGWRSGTEPTLGNPYSGYPNPNGVASVPESIPDVFLALRQSGMTRFGVRHRSASIGNRSLIYDLRFLKWEVPEGVPFAILLLAWDLQDDAC